MKQSSFKFLPSDLDRLILLHRPMKSEGSYCCLLLVRAHRHDKLVWPGMIPHILEAFNRNPGFNANLPKPPPLTLPGVDILEPSIKFLFPEDNLHGASTFARK